MGNKIGGRDFDYTDIKKKRCRGLCPGVRYFISNNVYNLDLIINE